MSKNSEYENAFPIFNQSNPFIDRTSPNQETVEEKTNFAKENKVAMRIQFQYSISLILL